MAPPTLSSEQKRQLAQRGYRWVQTIKRLNKAAEALEGDDAASKHSGVIDDLHMLGLALRHLDRCLEILSDSGDTLAGAAEFRAAWEAVRDLRDLLEHEEEYVAGQGWRPQLVDQSWLAAHYFEDNLVIWGGKGIDWVGFMGKTYRLRPAIVAALNLEAPLLDLWDPPGRTHTTNGN